MTINNTNEQPPLDYYAAQAEGMAVPNLPATNNNNSSLASREEIDNAFNDIWAQKSIDATEDWRANRLAGFDTGFRTINNHTDGLKGLVLLGGSSMLGKTTLALRFLYNIALGYKVGAPEREPINDKRPIPNIIIIAPDMQGVALRRRLLQFTADSKYRDAAELYKKGSAGLEQRLEVINQIDSAIKIIAKEQLAKLIKLYRGDIWEVISEGCKRRLDASNGRGLLIALDYMQCLLAFTSGSGIDADRELFTKVQELQDKTNGSTILAITEVRKGSKGDEGSVSKDDIIGSTRNVYGSDIVLALEAVRKTKADQTGGEFITETGERARRVKLHVLKVRDGGIATGSEPIDCEYYYQRNKYIETTKPIETGASPSPFDKTEANSDSGAETQAKEQLAEYEATEDDMPF